MASATVIYRLVGHRSFVQGYRVRVNVVRMRNSQFRQRKKVKVDFASIRETTRALSTSVKEIEDEITSLKE